MAKHSHKKYGMLSHAALLQKKKQRIIIARTHTVIIVETIKAIVLRSSVKNKNGHAKLSAIWIPHSMSAAVLTALFLPSAGVTSII